MSNIYQKYYFEMPNFVVMETYILNMSATDTSQNLN